MKQVNEATPRHFIDISALDAAILRRMLDMGHAMKRAGRTTPPELRPQDVASKVLVTIFEKPSTRTRVSFDVAMRQIGGSTIALNHTDLQLGRGEPVTDTARVLSRYCDVIVLRANEHRTLDLLAANSGVPVVNGLTDQSHPCQVMADLMTFEEARGPIKGRTIAWVGDGNNVLVSWMHAAAKFGFQLRIGCPAELKPDARVITWAKANGGALTFSDTAEDAVRDADCVVTDTWVSMGQTDGERRKELLRPFCVTPTLMAMAAGDAIFMHCLPAYRGHEVAAEVIDGPQSVVWDEAENRLHAQKAILAWCLGVD